MIEPADIITFLLMGCVTWLTRIMGYLVLHNRTLGSGGPGLSWKRHRVVY